MAGGRWVGDRMLTGPEDGDVAAKSVGARTVQACMARGWLETGEGTYRVRLTDAGAALLSDPACKPKGAIDG